MKHNSVMRIISPEELNRIQLEILDGVHAFCVKNSIRYSLAFGTLLGAVRHKGYIPWDDDIDIMMPRPDYNRFVTSFNGAFNHLVVAAPELDLGYYASYANVYDNRTLLIEGANGHRGMDLGVKIDVFPLDGIPLPEEDYMNLKKDLWVKNCVLYAKRIKLLKSKHKVSFIKTRIKNWFKSYKTIQKEITNTISKYSFDESDFVDVLAFNPYLHSTRFYSSVATDYNRVPFEDREYMCVKDYHSVLQGLYGDYMQLPPEEKRIPHHGFTAYWK